MVRKIIHIDMDAFYASVEQRDNPALRGKPVIVGGSPDSRGVVCAASYEARKFKVRSAMSCFKAARLCPQAIFVPPRFPVYVEVSRKLREIFGEVTDLIEPLALDEAYLDVTTNKIDEPSATKIAGYLKARIRGQLGLTASAGVAPNKFLAKLASEMKKPDGLCVIAPHQIAAAVAKLDIEKLWGVGPATAEKLRARGWNTTEDLRRLRPEDLAAVLGKLGPFVYGLAHGEDSRLVQANREAKSRGAETTFSKDVLEVPELEEALRGLAARVAESMTKRELFGRQICLKVRYSDFTTITRSQTLSQGSQDADCFWETAKDLLASATDAGRVPVRLVGISVSDFGAPQDNEDNDQLSFNSL